MNIPVPEVNITHFDITQWISDFGSIFADVDFSDLYGWLPSDIGGACSLLITFGIVMFVLGIIDRVIPL